jgi:hypothetical protein
MNVIESAYTKAITFLRDLFVYLFSGLFFLALMFVLIKMKDYSAPLVLEEMEGILPKNTALAVGILAMISYIMGQLLFTLSFLLFPAFKKVFKKFPKDPVGNFLVKRQQLHDYLMSIEKKEDDKSLLKAEPHLYYEMSVFVRRPDLHRRFIERYNLLMFMKRSLSSCLFFAGLTFVLAPPVINFHAALAGLALIVMSLVFYWGALSTEKGFLNRVFLSYLVSNETQTKQEH